MSQFASDHAQRVVGLYGDPTVSWSILLEARLGNVLAPEKAAERLRAATERYAHLGAPPLIEQVPAAELPAVRDRFAAAPYDRGAPLIRVAVSADEPAVLIAAHHGAVDGLGLLAVLGLVLDVPITSGATGIGARTADESFLLSALRRLAEALFAPPARISPDRGILVSSGAKPQAPAGGQAPLDPPREVYGDVFATRHEPRMRLGAAAFVAAAARTTEAWNRAHGRKTARVVAALGASRRGGAAPEPEPGSTFFRLRLTEEPSADDVSRILAGRHPEPDFPARSSRIARLGTRLLASRLGSTYLMSNLGAVSAGDLVLSIAFYPAASGRSGVAFGAATVGDTSTLTIRARRKDFDATAAGRLVDEFVRSVRGQDSR